MKKINKFSVMCQTETKRGNLIYLFIFIFITKYFIFVETGFNKKNTVNNFKFKECLRTLSFTFF